MNKEQKPTPNMLLKNARLEKGWTQQELADRVTEELGGKIVNVQSVGRWEQGKAFPDSEILPALCKVLGKRAEDLGLLWELYHPTKRDEKPDLTQATTDVKQEENQPVPPLVLPTPRNPSRKKHWLLVAIVGVVLLGIVGIMIIPKPWYPNPTPPEVTPTPSVTAIAPCVAAPILVEPVDGQTLNSRTVAFTWEPPQDCRPDGYTVRITANRDPDARPWIVDTGWAPTYYKYTFSADGTYYWHIRACKPCGNAFTPNSFHPGNWAIRIFTIHTSSTS